ncbi:hypothetical protein BVRB_3g056040 [Beta vulgaris subsp. vulgaris]|uniref:Uncharacterized protein n=1 Tax=Beta vulgaris subsp. vulgaris TaxID=3555 RepID=A0A0J8CVB8_BETVV|nr:hypothetical protein BVRB_3g056040 [Beta vulgaris subsp. vulgaris]
MPIISDKNRTTLLEDPLPALESAKKNCRYQRIEVRKRTLDVNTQKQDRLNQPVKRWGTKRKIIRLQPANFMSICHVRHQGKQVPI